MSRTIQHPDIEIQEVDRSEYTLNIVGTTCLVEGFSDKGEEYNITRLSSIQEYETLFGKPTNEAERYSYMACDEVIKNNGNLIFVKLPYNNDISSNYKYIGLTLGSDSETSGASQEILNQISGYYDNYSELTLSSLDNITKTDYDIIVAGGVFPSGVSSYDYLIVNENKAQIDSSTNEGIFVVVIDSVDALNVQRLIDGASETDIMDTLLGIDYPSDITSADFIDSLTGYFKNDSISKDLMLQFNPISYDAENDTIDKSYTQYLSVLVCNTIADENNDGKLRVGILEKFFGSIDTTARDISTGQSTYLGNLINANSKYIKWYKNSNATLPSSGSVLFKDASEYSLMGFTSAESAKIIKGGSIVSYLQNSHQKLSNIDEYEIDVVIDAGISTIAQFTDDVVSGTLYDPINDVDSNDTNITSISDIATWRSVCNEYINFCQKVRKDCIAILDTPRNLTLQGDVKYIRKTAPDNTFNNTIGTKLKYVTGLNSSYATLYSNWLRTTDPFNGIGFWIPQSVKMGGIFCYNDNVSNYWDAPVGFNRGIINGVNDISYDPSKKDADQVYLKSINYAKKYPLEGFIAEGQKTTQIKPSGFDRVNVRRLFLKLERATYNALKPYKYEPNNLFTRRRVVDAIDPLFREVKNKGGILDYQIICDERNNTGQVIDNNELRIAILIKPVKTAEFILVQFLNLSSTISFEEVIQTL